MAVGWRATNRIAYLWKSLHKNTRSGKYQCPGLFQKGELIEEGDFQLRTTDDGETPKDVGYW